MPKSWNDDKFSSFQWLWHCSFPSNAGIFIIVFELCPSILGEDKESLLCSSVFTLIMIGGWFTTFEVLGRFSVTVLDRYLTLGMDSDWMIAVSKGFSFDSGISMLLTTVEVL